ncbi:MAG: hypothetical protein ABR543_00210 [Gemmatimonadaceae bacterium]
MHKVALALLVLGVPSVLAAQADKKDPDIKVASGGRLPSGWMARLDRANAKLDELKFVTMGNGFHATSGPAAIYYNPAQVAKGEFVVRASMTQTKAPTHPEAYGVFIAGTNLDKADQAYLYFLVRGDGKALVKHRAGSETHTIMDWTETSAVKKADEAGKATNEIVINVARDTVHFLVNGTQVSAFSRKTMTPTDGQVGLRVNHNLDVHIGAFEVKLPK